MIDSEWEVGGWLEYHSARPPVDTDLDGIPDEWEKAHGLNPKDPSDASKPGADGYTNIEIYVNGLAESKPARASR